MRRLFFISLLMIAWLPFHAQNIMEVAKNKTFNWGAKVGCSAAIPVINSLTINDIEITDYDTQNKVGWQTAIFTRFNIKRFYIQPSAVWRKTEGDLRFKSFQQETKDLYQGRIKYKMNSIEIPILTGFNIIKEGPYALSIAVGPSFKYNYKVHYKTFSLQTSNKYTSDSSPFNLNIATGINVCIGRLFLDFNYEFGLNQIESKLKSSENKTNKYASIIIDRRTNLLSFSLGFVF